MGIIFIGTPEFSVPSLRRLADSGSEISTVITQPDRPAGRGRQPRASPVKEVANALGLSVFQPATLRDEAAIDRIKALDPELMVAVAFGQILRPEFLAIAPKGVVNVHPSLLPKYRGPSPIQSAILAGDDFTGVTIMLMDAGMDSGPILAQKDVAIDSEDTGGSLSARLADVGARLLVDTLASWQDGSITPMPQDDGAATVTRLVRKEDGLIDWTQTAAQISRQVRAFDPWPGTYTTFLGDKLSVRRAALVVGGPAGHAGQVVDLGSGSNEASIAVSTGNGLLRLIEVQREGRKRLAIADFARGNKELVGSTLGL